MSNIRYVVAAYDMVYNDEWNYKVEEPGFGFPCKLFKEREAAEVYLDQIDNQRWREILEEYGSTPVGTQVTIGWDKMGDMVEEHVEIENPVYTGVELNHYMLDARIFNEVDQTLKEAGYPLNHTISDEGLRLFKKLLLEKTGENPFLHFIQEIELED